MQALRVFGSRCPREQGARSSGVQEGPISAHARRHGLIAGPIPMLKKIAVSDVRLGMHIHKLEGAWISHPFWKTKFVIDSAQDLHELQASGLADCWIDD